jgi:hypothetical protein
VLDHRPHRRRVEHLTRPHPPARSRRMDRLPDPRMKARTPIPTARTAVWPDRMAASVRPRPRSARSVLCAGRAMPDRIGRKDVQSARARTHTQWGLSSVCPTVCSRWGAGRVRGPRRRTWHGHGAGAASGGGPCTVRL